MHNTASAAATHVANDMLLFLQPDIAPIDNLPAGRELSFGGPAFGTTWSVRLVMKGQTGPARLLQRREALQRQCESVLALIDQQMSLWIPESHISRYNGLADGQSMPLPEPMRGLVIEAMALHRETHGAFDPFIGEATDLWGFGPVAVPEGLPAGKTLHALRARRANTRPDFTGGHLVRKAGHALDLCGIAKGYAVDLIAERMLGEHDVASVLVEVGGEIKGHGVKNNGMPWWVDLQWPDIGSDIRLRVALHGWACASSGTGERYFELGHRRYSHAIDPVSAEPVHRDLGGVAVLDPLCWRADALATALLVAGRERAIALAERLSLPCVLHSAPESQPPYYSSALQRWLSDD
ncbi:FAD:protein FMN transferase [Novosphingobium indicum]|uniref:FAD:protein FMN transferase n=1 Tax=Novosphingobium indicum TaxID=462949 RepID=A0ABQ2JZZ3_9SPHN|nr:FAD:protein FMN transferase [Novosphingobium indicum]GGN60668.1 FAD:protein FMN transferase [Novosphingobium indicum]